MAVANLTTHANALTTNYRGVAEGLFYNDSLFQLLGEPSQRSVSGDRYISWLVHSSGNTGVEVFSEDTTYPTPTYQTMTKAVVSPVYARIPVQITGIALDAVGSGGNYNLIDTELSHGISQVKDLLVTSMIGGTYGLELGVDYGSSYAGITRNGSAAYFEATETAVDGALEVADLEDLLETVEAPEKAGKPNVWLAARNQITNISRLSPQSGMSVFAPNDKGQALVNPTFAGIPIVHLPDLTSTVIALCDFNPGEVVWEYWRPFTITQLGIDGDDSKFQLSCAIGFAMLNPRHNGKLTGVTA